MSGKSDENKSFEPNQIAPSLYIMRELCYFSRDQWEIKKHLLWGICFYDIMIYREASWPMRDINTLQCVDILHWRDFPIQDKRHGLVQMCPWCPCKMSENLTTAGKKEWKFTFERFRENVIDCLYLNKNMINASWNLKLIMEDIWNLNIIVIWYIHTPVFSKNQQLL